ncbi:retrovirus-related pol polyprotein from transposon TNT 1-94 [Tanacetum coccineum]
MVQRIVLTRPNAVVNTARPKAVLSAVKGNKGNVVKASAYPCQHMTGKYQIYNAYYEEVDGGFVSFGGNSKGGKITGKGKIRTGKLDFKDMCPVTILNTIDHLGKFDGKADEGFFIGYSTNRKAFRVFSSRTRIVEENLHVQFSKARMETIPVKDYILLPLSIQDLSFSSSLKDSLDAGFKTSGEEEKKDAEDPGNEDSEVPSTEEPRKKSRK